MPGVRFPSDGLRITTRLDLRVPGWGQLWLVSMGVGPGHSEVPGVYGSPLGGCGWLGPKGGYRPARCSNPVNG